MERYGTDDDVIDTNRALWNRAHRESRFRPRYPHDQVVRWAFREFERASQPPPHLLDLGSGAGRHALFLAAEGFKVSACDVSAEALTALTTAATQRGYAIPTQECSADNLSAYADGIFDGILCFGVLYYLPLPKIERTLREIHRLLKPGGKLLCVTRSDKDDRLLHAQPLGPSTYVLASLASNAPSSLEEGLSMVFLSERSLQALMSRFEITDLGRMRVTHGGFSDDDWVVAARKPGQTP